jgi:hypothetical protein
VSAFCALQRQNLTEMRQAEPPAHHKQRLHVCVPDVFQELLATARRWLLPDGTRLARRFSGKAASHGRRATAAPKSRTWLNLVRLSVPKQIQNRDAIDDSDTQR